MTSLHAYVVVLAFEAPGPLHVNSILAPDPASAGALAMLMFMRHTPTDAPLLNCLCAEAPVEQLRYLLRAVESGKPPGEVVSLVPRDQRAAEILRQHPEVDAADASTFTGSAVNDLWRDYDPWKFSEPPMPPGAA